MNAVLVLCVLLCVYAVYSQFVLWPRYRDEHGCVETGSSREVLTMCGKTPCYLTEFEYRCDTGMIWR